MSASSTAAGCLHHGTQDSRRSTCCSPIHCMHVDMHGMITPTVSHLMSCYHGTLVLVVLQLTASVVVAPCQLGMSLWGGLSLCGGYADAG